MNNILLISWQKTEISMKEIQNTFRHDRTFKIHVVVCSSTLDHAIQDSITHGVDSPVAYLINI